VLRRLIARNQRSWMEAVAGATGGSAGADWVYQPRPHGELLVPFPEQPPGADVLARARELGARRLGCWLVEPSAPVEDALAGLGFTRGWDPHWMAAPAAASELDPRVSEPADAPPEYDDYGRALFGMAGRGSSLFVAREADGAFAGHAWLHVAAGVGGIYDVFVTEGRRRRGLGTALSNAASAKAAALGVETMALNAEFAPLYESLGYRSLGTGRTWWLHLSDRRSSAAAPDRPS
jgi:GNAT superfamily N-acetyltransferase